MKGLKGNTSLTSLNVVGNSFYDEGAKYVMEGLKGNSSLTSLNVAGNCIGVEGSQYIMEGLKGNSSLISLNVVGNSIGVEGSKYIMEGLKGNSSLTSLDVGYSRIGDKGSKYIMEGLKGNSSLLNIHGIHINPSKKLTSLLQRNQKARELVRRSALCLCWIRNRHQYECGLLGLVPKELVKYISQLIWKSRGQWCWIKK